MQMTEHHELDVLESHVRTGPVGPVFGLAFVALGRAGRRERGLGREMRLAEKCSLITRARQRAGEALRAYLRIEIDAVVPYAVRERQESGKNRCTRRLAHEVRRDARLEARAVTR